MRDHPGMTAEERLSFRILDQHIQFYCPDAAVRRLLLANYGGLAVAVEEGEPDLRYSAIWERGAFSLVREGRPTLAGEDAADFLFLLEKELTVELQKRRADLFFLHSAAVEWRGRACLLVGESGAGKSTTTWALLQHGFGYLSDELSPVNLSSMEVLPYAHALCIKQPLSEYPMPHECLDLGSTLHVPVRSLPGPVVRKPKPLASLFILTRQPGLSEPELRMIGPAEAGTRLYANALNAGAHRNWGLDAVLHIAQYAPCFALAPADLRRTCAMISAAIERSS